MKITLEISDVVVVVEADVVTANDILEMFKNAMLAQGFHPETLKGIFGDE